VPELVPEPVQLLIELLIIKRSNTGSGQNDDIKIGNVILPVTEGFTHKTFDPVPVSGALDVFARYDDTQSRSAGFECPGR